MAKVSEDERRSMEREIEAWRSSGQTLSAWARARGISRERLQYWKRRFVRKEGALGMGGRLARIPVVSPPVEAAPGAPIEIRVEGARLRILLPAGFDVGALARLLDVVQARC